MRRILSVTLVLCLLAGCGSAPGAGPAPGGKEPAPEMATSAPQPQPWEADPNGYLLDILKRELPDNDDVRFWIFPGSGPFLVRMGEEEYGEAIRELFSALDWEVTQRPQYEETETPPGSLPGAYGVQLLSGSESQTIYCHSHEDVIWLDSSSLDGIQVYLRADGAETLCDDLADLWPGPEADFGRIRVRPLGDKEATARQFMEDLFAKLKADGHITGAQVRSLAVLPPYPPEGEEGYDPDRISFQTTFALQPTRPELSYWQDNGLDDANWATYETVKVVISLDARDGAYGLYDLQL